MVSPSVVPTPSPSLFWLQGAALLSEHPAAAREPGQQHPPAMAGPRALKFGAAPGREGSPSSRARRGCGHSQARGWALSLLPFPASPEAAPSPALVFRCKAKGHGVPALSPRVSSSTGTAQGFKRRNLYNMCCSPQREQDRLQQQSSSRGHKLVGPGFWAARMLSPSADNAMPDLHTCGIPASLVFQSQLALSSCFLYLRHTHTQTHP